MASVENTTPIKQFTLNTGIKMPAVGLGTYRIKKAGDIMKSVDHALSCGYRMFDTAAVYFNEHYLKDAFETLLPKYGLQRKDIFITTKLAPADLTRPKEAFANSLQNLGVDYVDLYLIHFPANLKLGDQSTENAKTRDVAWKGLAEVFKDGKAKAVGVSNYTLLHLRELMNNNYGVIPAVNQVEWHPYYYQNDLLEYCTSNGIVLQAYSSLGTSANSFDTNSILYEPSVTQIAKKLNVTNAQVLLAWSLQRGVAVIPKSTNPKHIKENISLDFNIEEEDMNAINALGQRNLKYAWNPSSVI